MAWCGRAVDGEWLRVGVKKTASSTALCRTLRRIIFPFVRKTGWGVRVGQTEGIPCIFAMSREGVVQGLGLTKLFWVHLAAAGSLAFHRPLSHVGGRSR